MSESISTTQPPATGRDRILEEALHRFIGSGFAAVSMQQIADGAGVTKATLYHHFRDKEALFLETVRIALDQSQTRLATAVESGQTLDAKLRSVARYLYSSERSDLARLFGDLHLHVSSEKQEAFWSSAEQPWMLLADAIRNAVERGEITAVEPQLAARMVFGAIATQPQFARYHSSVPHPDEATADRIVDMLMRGLDAR